MLLYIYIYIYITGGEFTAPVTRFVSMVSQQASWSADIILRFHFTYICSEVSPTSITLMLTRYFIIQYDPSQKNQNKLNIKSTIHAVNLEHQVLVPKPVKFIKDTREYMYYIIIMVDCRILSIHLSQNLKC